MAAPVTQQAHTLAERLPQRFHLQGDRPRVIFPSALELTLEQEQRLLQHARQRFEDLCRDSGRPVFDVPNHEPEWSHDTLREGLRSFMGRQFFSHLMFHGRVEWRAAQTGSIYEETNLHLPLSRRILTQQIARAIAYITGTEPWWSATDIGNEDLEFSKKLERWLRHELHTEGDLTSDINQIIELVWIQGQQVTKTYHEKAVDYYETVANVAIDANGEPVMALDGDFIYATDTFVPPPPVPMLDETTGEMVEVMPPPGAPTVLKRDLRTPMPPVGQDGKIVFKAMKITRELEVANRPKAGPIFYLDFLCPLDAEDIQTADMVCHLYDRTVIQLAHKYQSESFQDQSAESQLQIMSGLVHDMLQVSTTHRADMAGANAARAEHGEVPNSMGRDNEEPMSRLVECWMHYDVNGDGIMEHIVLLMDRSGAVPLFYDYVANVTNDGLRPFRVSRINPVAGRWYGQGMMDTFANLQEAVDLMLNRWNFSQSSSARIDFTHPERTVEGQADSSFKLNWGQQFTPLGLYTAKDIIESVYLTDIKSEHIHVLLEFLLQMGMNMSGVTNVNDGQALGMDTSKLATGVKNLERSGMELFGKYLADITPGIRQIVTACMELSLRHLDKPKAFRFFEGDMGRLGTITPEEVRTVKLDVRIELTRYRGEQDEVQARMATELAKEFYTLPLILQQRLLPLYRQRLQSLQIRNVDELLVPTEFMAPALPAGTGAPPPPTL